MEIKNKKMDLNASYELCIIINRDM